MALLIYASPRSVFKSESEKSRPISAFTEDSLNHYTVLGPLPWKVVSYCVFSAHSSPSACRATFSHIVARQLPHYHIQPLLSKVPWGRDAQCSAPQASRGDVGGHRRRADCCSQNSPLSIAQNWLVIRKPRQQTVKKKKLMIFKLETSYSTTP